MYIGHEPLKPMSSSVCTRGFGEQSPETNDLGCFPSSGQQSYWAEGNKWATYCENVLFFLNDVAVVTIVISNYVCYRFARTHIFIYYCKLAIYVET